MTDAMTKRLAALAGGFLLLAGACAAGELSLTLAAGYSYKAVIAQARMIEIACSLLGIGALVVTWAAARPADNRLRRFALAAMGIGLISFGRASTLIAGHWPPNERLPITDALLYYLGALVVTVMVPVLGGSLLAGRYRVSGALVTGGAVLIGLARFDDAAFPFAVVLVVVGLAVIGLMAVLGSHSADDEWREAGGTTVPTSGNA